ncbi:MAG: alpha/beta fold hydrolase [Pseudomonadota bacterium]
MQSLNKLDHPTIRSLLLQPPSDHSGSRPANAEDLRLTISKDVHLSCRFYLSAPAAPTLIYFHGGNESSASFDAEAAYFNQVGINIFLTSLRGFGKSTGIPSLSDMTTDAEIQFIQALQWLTATGYSGAILVMGRSLGSVCAIDVAHTHPDKIKALILESAVCETLPLLTALEADKVTTLISEEEGFNNLQKIAEIKTPTLIFHGSRDVLVPISQAEKLQAISGAKNKQFLIIPGAEHHTVSKTGGSLYFTTIKDFVDKVCGVNTWRQRRREFKTDQDRGTT